jgi:hypothetical protein
MILFRFLIPFTFLMAFVVLCAADGVVSHEFESVQKFDDLYANGITSSGHYTMTISRPIFSGEQRLPIKHEWLYTQTGKLRASLEVAEKEPKIYKDGTTEFHREIILFASRMSGRKQIFLDGKVPIRDYALSKDLASSVKEVHAVDAETLSLQIDKFIFALGRGICRKISSLSGTDMPKQINYKGESCLYFTGQGNYMSGKGMWEVYVSPNGDYMVRHAQFTKNDEVLVEVNTFGTNSNGECLYPDRSEVKVCPASLNIVHTFNFSSAKFEFDSALFEQVQKDFDAEMPLNSVVIDTSTGRHTAQVIGGEEPVTFDMPERLINWNRIILVIIVNITGILLLLYLYLRNHRKK